MSSSEHMSFWEHLQELRSRLLRSLGAVLLAFGLTYWLRFRIWEWAQKPFLEVFRERLAKDAPQAAGLDPFAFTGLTEPFFSMLRLSLWAAAFLAAPFLFYQVWSFIRPGLYPRERRWAIPFVVVTSLCFLAGAAFAYSSAFRILGDVLFQEALQAGLRANLRVEEYLDLFLSTVLGMGLLFELPVLVFFLARFRVLSAGKMLRLWRHATVLILVVASFLTPGDIVVTTILFSAVLLGLYFISVLVAWIAAPRNITSE